MARVIHEGNGTVRNALGMLQNAEAEKKTDCSQTDLGNSIIFGCCTYEVDKEGKPVGTAKCSKELCSKDPYPNGHAYQSKK
ncbi:MAG TPA: hypothetical protein VF884_15255 [Nitrososphaeraceae archaeon]